MSAQWASDYRVLPDNVCRACLWVPAAPSLSVALSRASDCCSVRRLLYGSVRLLTGLRLDWCAPAMVRGCSVDGSRESVDVILADGCIEVGPPEPY